MGGIRILGLGRATGDVVVTNDDMSRRVDTSDQWIREKSGIRERNFAHGKTNADMASEAAAMAIADAGINPGQISCLLVCTFTADRLSPSVACQTAGKLGLKEEIFAADMNGACTGFLYGCKVAEGFLSAQPDVNKTYGLVIGSEKISPVLNMGDRTTCVLFGDGAGAAVVEYAAELNSGFFCGCQPDVDVLKCERDGFVEMNGQEVYRFAVGTVPGCLETVMERAEVSCDDVDWFVCHQANERIIDNAAKRLRGQEHKFYKNLYWYGNTSAASIPIALCDMKKEGRLSAGQKIVCAGFGAGLTYAGMLLETAK